VTAALGGPGGVLTGDDTGSEKKGILLGRGAAAVHRHGREDHELPAGSVPGLRLAEGAGAHRPGAVPVRSWTGGQERLAAAKVPEGTAFKTKPQLLQAMIERAIAAGVPFDDVRCGGEGCRWLGPSS
jgi:hypothetical protein